MSEGAVDKEEQKLKMKLLENHNSKEQNRQKLKRLEKTIEEYEELAHLEAQFYNDTYLMNWDSQTASMIYELMMDSERLTKLGHEQLDMVKEQLLKENKRLQKQEDELEIKKRQFFQDKEVNL